MKKVWFLLFFALPLTGTIPHHSSETDHMHLYLWGLYNHLEHNSHAAQVALQQIIHNNGSVYAYAGYIDYLFGQQYYQDVLAMAPLITKKLAHLPHQQVILAKSFEIMGNAAEADRLMISLHNTHKHLPEIAYSAAIAHIRNGSSSQALAVAHDFLDHQQDAHTHFLFHFLCAQVYLRMNNMEKAQAHIQHTITGNPQFEQGWLLFGLIHETQGNLDQAMRGYQAFLTLVGHHDGVENQIALIAHQKQNRRKDLFQYALQLHRAKAYPQALTILNTHIKNHPRHVPAILLKVEILCTLHQREIAMQELQKHLAENTENPYLRKAILFISKPTPTSTSETN
ncbi:MAG: hypothetical protein WCE21_00675 [Candidatus Babeliales bacterium]